MNLWNPTFRFYAERVIRELMAHTANHPLVIGFQLDNETKHFGNTGNQIQEKFLRLQAYSHLASRAYGLLYWNWHSIHHRYVTYWFVLFSHDLLELLAYVEACVFGHEWFLLWAENLQIF